MPIRYKVKRKYRKHPSGWKQEVGIVATAYDGRKVIGRVGANKAAYSYDIQGANLVEGYLRKGIGSELYRLVAEEACASGMRLRSLDFGRNRLSEGFWKKQLRKGRATRGDRYVEMSCPVPRRLDGSRKI